MGNPNREITQTYMKACLEADKRHLERVREGKDWEESSNQRFSEISGYAKTYLKNYKGN
jgi:hypothetical protein